MSQFLGHSFEWWAKVLNVMQIYGVKDADDLAFKLRSRGNKPVEPEAPT